MIECRYLTVKTVNKTILKNISLKLEKETINVIIGANGGGKSTFLRAISQNIPYSGDILINGNNIKNIKRKQRARLIAMMPQELPNIPVDVRALVSFGRYPYTKSSGILSKNDISAVEKAINETNIKNIADFKTEILSGGEKRKTFLP